MSPNITEHFGLKEGEKGFDIFTDEHSHMYLTHTDVLDSVTTELSKSHIEQTPLKLVITGNYGVGKTHTLNHIKYLYNEEKAYGKTFSYFVVMGDIKKKTTYQHLHQKILDSIGFDKISDIVRRYIQKYATEDPESRMREKAQNHNLSTVVNKITYGGIANIAWKWLCGRKLTASELQNLEVTSNLEQSDDLVGCLTFFGDLYKEIEDKTIVILIDEWEYIANVQDQDAVSTWIQAIRNLADNVHNKHVGFVIASTPQAMSETTSGAGVLGQDSIKTRIGYPNNYKELEWLSIEDSKQFIRNVLESKIDKDKVNKELYTEIYPFTEESLETFIDELDQAPERRVPRNIITNIKGIATNSIIEGSKIFTNNAVIAALEE